MRATRFTPKQREQLRVFLRVGKRIESCPDDVKIGLVSMLEIITNDETDGQEKSAAFYTIADAIFPPEITSEPFDFELGEAK